VGCGLYLETSGNQVVGVYPSTSHPTNAGKICVRGWHVHEIASSPDRLKTPLLKKNGRLEPVSWEEALGFIANRLREIRQNHGPDSLAFLNSPRCSNEEAYLLQKLARSVIGTNNVDHGTGIYCNNSINVLLEMIGMPATTNSIAELGKSEVIIVDAMDLARRVPTVGGVVIRAKLNGSKLIVIGTRRHRVADQADYFLQTKPGTEAVLYGAMAKVIEDRGLADLPFIRSRCRNYESFLAHARQYDLLEAAERCGVSADLIENAALTYARAGAAALLFSSSMEDRTAESIQGMVNLVLLTGNLGKPGAGIFALAEQNNLQGVCDVGVLPDRLPGYQPVADPAARAALEAVWKTKIPEGPGMDAASVLADRGHGKIKGLWLSRYSPIATSFFGDIAGSLRECELIVLQHLFLTEAAQYAHVVLPTTAYGEERVSFTSTDRRIQLAQQAIQPPAELMPAWQQLTQLARLLGADWNYQSADEVMREIGEVVPFYSGASYDNLAREYGRQWPCTKDRPLGTGFLFGDQTATPCFQFVPVPKPPRPAPAPKEFPFTLVFGNSLYYWNQNVLIRHSGTLKREYRSLFLDYPDGFIELNPDDAKRLGVRDGERIRVCAAHASAASTARVTPEVRSGTIYVPYFVRDVAREILGKAEFGSQLVPVRVEKEAS
jgi:predicted molibdopterin-dependent oxidoreductase YjgC